MMCRGVDIDIDASIWISMHLYGCRCIAYLSMHRRQFLCILLALTAYMSSTCVCELVCNEADVYDMNIVCMFHIYETTRRGVYARNIDIDASIWISMHRLSIDASKIILMHIACIYCVCEFDMCKRTCLYRMPYV